MNTDLIKKSKNYFENDFFKFMKNAVFKKIWKIFENIEILNLSQQKEKETICVRTKLPYYKVLCRKVISNRNDKNRDTYK